MARPGNTRQILFEFYSRSIPHRAIVALTWEFSDVKV